MQPNFEIIKTAFYQAFADSTEANIAVLKESINGGHLLPSWHKRKDKFKNELNSWLNRLDIRQVNSLILLLKAQNKAVPKWAAQWQYNIDYNEKGFLDLIKTENN